MKTNLKLLLWVIGFSVFWSANIFAQMPVSPVNATNVIDANTTVNWSPFGSGSYGYEYKINAPLTGVPSDHTGAPTAPTASTFFTISAAILNVGDVVSWGVMDAGALPVWFTYTFTVGTPSPNPANGATAVTQGLASVSWIDYDEGGFGYGPYDVDFDDSPGFGSIDASAAGTGATSLALPALTYNTPYYWRLRDTDINGGGLDGTWHSYSFTTEIATPVLTGPVNGVTGESTPVSLSWTFAGSSAGVQFDLEYHTGGGWGTMTTVSNIGASPYSFAALNNTTYTWRIKATKGGETTTSGERTFTTELATPTLTTPAHTSTFLYTDPVTFAWTISGSYSNVDFTVTVATDAGFTLNVQTSTVSNVLTTTISIPKADTYYWKVYAVVTGGANVGENVTVGGTGTPWFKMTLPGPSLTIPVNGLTGVSVEPTTTWAAVSGATSYKLYVDDADDGWGTPLYAVDQGTNLTKAFNETIANFPLTNSTKYYWKVASVDADGVEYASSTYHFTTIPAVTVYQTDPANGVLVYSTTASVSWYASQPIGTMKYKVQHKLDEVLGTPGSAPTAAEWATATSTTVTALTADLTVLAGKKYWWRVIVLNSSLEVISYSSALNFTVIGGTNISIVQTWPISNPTVYTLTPKVYWYPDQYALGVTYTVYYNKLGDTNADTYIGPGDTDVVTKAAGSDINAQLPTLVSGTKYYWSVQAAYNGEFTYSGIESFTIYTIVPVAVPIPTYPIGGVTVYTTSPWVYYYTGTDVSGAYFDLDIATAAGTQDGLADFSTSSAGVLKIQVTGRTPGETYYYKLRSKSVIGVPGAGESSAWSSEASFTVAGGVANGYPVATWPVGTPIEYTRKPELNWYLEGSSLGITGYIVKYSTTDQAAGAGWTAFTPGGPNATEGSIVIGSAATTSYTFGTDLTYGETYYWAVASTSASGVSAYSTGAFTIYGPAAAVAPTLTLPHDATTIGSLSPTLYWFINGSTVGFTSYTLVYSTSDVFAGGATTTDAGITDDFKALSSLTPGATYYWYVTAVYTQGSATSSTWTFTVDPGASSVQPLIGGPNNVNVGTVSPTISWVLPAISQSELTYQLEVADNPEFANAMVYEGVTTPYQNLSGLEPGKEYHWRVRSSTAAGDISNYSGTGKFVVNANITGMEDEKIIPTEFTVMQNYPNPFNPTTTINYSLPEAAFVSIKVFDMLGREIKTLINTDLTEGIHSVNWNGDDNFGNKVSSGTYIYRVIAGKNVVSRKMVLLK